MHTVMIPKKIEDYIKARNDALSLVDTAISAIQNATAILEEVGIHYPYSGGMREGRKAIVQEMDQRFWRKSFTVAGFFSVMDSQAMNEFNKDLERVPPEFSMDTIKATFLSVAQDSDEIFKRGIVNIFKRLSADYKTNTKEPFTIGEKCICGYITSNFYGYVSIGNHSSAPAMINDIDRVFKVLDNKPHIPRSLESAINEAWKNGEPYEDDYYHIKGFKNGNAHFKFKRLDLVKKVNELIFEWYGENVLPQG